MRPLIVAGFILCGCACPGLAQDELIEQGRLLAISLCGGCHAVGPNHESPHAQAPPFRAIDRRVDLDAFFQRLREGVTSGHPDMPTFRFTREDARAFLAYLRSIQR
jgi:mono/diheme cytochrome c family protein